MFTDTQRTYELKNTLEEQGAKEWTGEKRYAELQYHVGKIYRDGLKNEFVCCVATVDFSPAVEKYPTHYYSFRWINKDGKPGRRGFNQVGYIFDMRRA